MTTQTRPDIKNEFRELVSEGEGLLANTRFTGPNFEQFPALRGTISDSELSEKVRAADTRLPRGAEAPGSSQGHLAVYTGLRRSEVLGLRWRDNNLGGHQLSVGQTKHSLGGDRGVVFEEPKTEKSGQPVALPEATVQELGSHFAAQGEPGPEDLVVVGPHGGPALPDSVSHSFRRLAGRVGFPDFTLRDLRHTHGSLGLWGEPESGAGETPAC